ncbi:MAG: late competence development ComFB family protein [Acutalibacteraceae bacterium]|nr:late competence development ComFB family protein [Clostridiales bacterium]
MASKKSFDREKMYRKIMPTYYDNTEVEAEYEDNKPELTVLPFNSKNDNESDSTLLYSKEINRLRDRDEKVVLYNITEKLVLEKLDVVLDSMTCCKCDRCKMDIVAMALNNLEPQYVVKTKGMIEDKDIESEISQGITSAVLKAALAVRKRPRH